MKTDEIIEGAGQIKPIAAGRTEYTDIVRPVTIKIRRNGNITRRPKMEERIIWAITVRNIPIAYDRPKNADVRLSVAAKTGRTSKKPKIKAAVKPIWEISFTTALQL
ncbi:MAG TPA: hypothetical protein VGO50_11635, partial [Pyrinomonadaceae bacterium]|nr:hypothetical protein [Pyrinomonadaceae bacterium]